jgi:amino acid adenylation domain-containing protein
LPEKTAPMSNAIRGLNKLTAHEKRTLLARLIEERQAERPTVSSIPSAFDAQVEASPAAVAVAAADGSLTYLELSARANQLARYLRRLGVGPEVRVGLCVERSLELLVGILGIMKAGGAYVAIDPEYPSERLLYLMNDSRAAVILTQERLAASVPAGDARLVRLDADWPQIARESDAPLPAAARPENAAYVIYTSGSTGRPKGALVTHRNLAQSTQARVFYYREPVGRFLLASSYAFDSSVAGLFWTLVTGGTLVIPASSEAVDPPALARLIGRERVTHVLCVPSLYALVLESAPAGRLYSLRTVIVAGEECPRDLPARHWSALPHATLDNEYGPTEATVWATVHRCSDDGDARGPVPIGRPIASSRSYVLDRMLQPVPVGVAGELYIGGAGVARGYLDRPALTAERFLPDPFAGTAGARMYRTSDLARFRGDGVIEYLGRVDRQVKIRGYRIELGEIEAALQEHPSVRLAAADVRGGSNGERRLVGYLVPRDVERPSESTLRGWLKDRLPDYMLPSAFVALESLPLSPNGKLDRKSLPDPDDARLLAPDSAHVPPRGPIEEALAAIWSEVLSLDRLGVHDNLFDLGGHSLNVAQALARVRETLGVEIPLRAVFEAPTIAAVASAVETALGSAPPANVPPLVPVARDSPLAASLAQQRLWFLDQLEPGRAWYNVPALVRVRGLLDVRALERAFDELVRRHESLRTTFAAGQGELVQVIGPARAVGLPVDGLEGVPESEREGEALQRARAESWRTFDLASGPLLRVRLFQVAAEEHVLAVTMHHVVSDAWSMAVLIREIGALYEAFSQGRPSPLAELPVQYADFAAWQRLTQSAEIVESQIGYWREALEGVPALNLPADRPRPTLPSGQGGERARLYSKSLADGLRALARTEGATLYMVLLAGFEAVLARHSGQTDFAVGSPIAGRTRWETERLIGFFVNTLVHRADLSGSPSFRELVRRVRQTAFGAYAHQDLPFEQLVAALHPERDTSRSPLFQVMFVLQNAPAPELQVSGLSLCPVPLPSEWSKFDLTLSMTETSEGLAGTLEYSVDLFDDATAERLLGHLETLLDAAARSPDVPIASLPMLSGAELDALAQWNAATAESPDASCVHELFEKQAERCPEAAAVRFEGQDLSYAELNARANRLAHYLRSLGVGPDVIVGVCLHRTPALVASLLGVLKSGSAYLPLDPSYPAERLDWMLEDARVRVLITDQGIAARLHCDGAEVVCIDRAADRAAIDRQLAGNPAGRPRPDNLAYVIYTSGSTGRPKGATIVHHGLSNYVSWCVRAYGVAAGEGAPVHSSISFDLTVTSLFAPLAAGRRIDLLAEDEGVEALAGALKGPARYSLVKITPAHLQLLTTQLRPEEARGKTGAFVIGGEQLDAATLAFWRANAPETALVNEYGPTETVVGCCVYTVAPDDPETGDVPIGRPIASTRLYVLDAALRRVPSGVTGELYIGGAGVARGYLRRPALTAELFLPDPFAPEPGARMYRTGDLARWRAHGVMEFLGRTDQQVKIRGYRIELGEVEACLRGHASVREAVAVVRRQDAVDARLVAYVVPRDETALSIGELRAWLRERLPDYMVPSAFAVLASLPLTPNGKVDREALPALEAGGALGGSVHVAPRTAIEEVVASVWAEVLGCDQRGLGIDDEFFELGGHSLLATRVVSRLRDALRVEVPLRWLFDAPTLGGLARRLEGVLAGDGDGLPEPIPRVPRDRPLPASYSQESLWFLDQLAPGRPTFNTGGAVRILGPLEADALSRAFDEIVRRHDTLRTSFAVESGRPVQKIAPPGSRGHALRLIDLGDRGEGERLAEARRLAAEELRRPFELARGPLARAELLRLSEGDHVLVLAMHHIVTDGWSLNVAARELLTLHDAFRRDLPSPLPELPVQYADYAVWQRSRLAGERLDELISHWSSRLAGVPPLELPTDRPRPAVRSGRGGLVSFRLDAGLAGSLRTLARAEGATPFMILLAAFQTLLSRYSGQDDFAIGAPLANRLRAEIEPLVGYFINMIALRTDTSGDPSFRALLGRVRRTSLDAFEHQQLPLDLLLEAIRPARDPSRTPLFQVMFVFQNNEVPSVGGDLAIEPLAAEHENGTAKFDLTLALGDEGSGMSGSFEYDSDLFDRATVERMLSHFQTLLESVVADPDRPIGALNLQPDRERRQLARWQGGSGEVPFDRPIHRIVAERARRTPRAEAIVCEGERWTYERLDGQANRIAQLLIRAGVAADDRIGLFLPKSPELIAAMLGTLKAGAAYVPIDPSQPVARRAAIVADAGARVLLTLSGLDTSWAVGLPHLVRFEVQDDATADQPATDPGVATDPEGLAYVIYTSGSTAAPKGVMVPHRGLVTAFRGWRATYELGTRATRHLQMASPAFDVFTGDWVRALGSGGTLVLCPREVMLDPDALIALLKRERIDIAEFVPAVIDLVMDRLEQSGGDLNGLRLAVVGSAAWRAEQYERLKQFCGVGARVVNTYGLTEATIDSTLFEGELSSAGAGAFAPIGRPFPGTRVHVLDSRMRPVPLGVAGELYIGGSCVARGYLGKRAATAERFVPDPFSSAGGARLYRTGDRARWRDDGQLEFLGRGDDQVKIRGFRVELGEVVAALRSLPGVREATVVARAGAAGHERLDAYVVPADGATADADLLRRGLSALVPGHMVPATFTSLGALPMTPSGKVDRRALPEPDGESTIRLHEVVAPRDEVEARLVAIWEDLLGVRPVGVTDSFFERGGHSLLAIRLLWRVEAEFGRSLPLAWLFQGPTVAHLAEWLRAPQSKSSAAAWTPLVPIQTEGQGRPFFCVHPVGGIVYCFHELARALGEARSFHALQAAGLEVNQAPVENMEEIAASYVHAMRAAQPEGPYHLGGWSFGGVVAFEMARQLSEQGQEIASLVVFDSWAPAGEARALPESLEPLAQEIAALELLGPGDVTAERRDDALVLAALAGEYQGDLPKLITHLRALSPEARRGELVRLLGLDRAYPLETGPERIERFLAVLRANWLAGARYVPRPYPGRVTLFRAREERGAGSDDPTLGWHSLAAGGVTVHTVPGDHDSMLKPPAVAVLAELLENAFKLGSGS